MTTDLASFASPHPERPPAPVAVDWPGVESWLGVNLPDDYKQLAVKYGPLDFGDYLWVHVPCAARGRYDYGGWLSQAHREARRAVRQLPWRARPSVHPEPGGLLAWGGSRGTDLLFWDTSSSTDPNEWTVVVRHAVQTPLQNDLRPWHHYDLTLTEYLRQTVRHLGAVGTKHSAYQLDCHDRQLIGPLNATMARTAYLVDARPWTPPAPRPTRPTEPRRRTVPESDSDLEALCLLTPPPKSPYLGDGYWETLYTELGTTLPDEYVRLMERYGAGCWSERLRFLTPLRPVPGQGFVAHVRTVTESYAELASEDDAQRYPLRMWPDPGGFLPFANTIDGDHLGWLTVGKRPNDWPLIVWPRQADQSQMLDHGLIDTLLAWLRGKPHTKDLATFNADGDPVDFATFEPWDNDGYW